MKKIYTISLLFNLCVIILIIFLAFRGKNIFYKIIFEKVISVRHDQKVSMFRASPISNGAIVFVGNSITEGGNWPELFPDKIILNRGIGGDVTEGILRRIDEVIRHQPSKLFICIGTNDLAKGIEQDVIIKNYKTILNKIKEQSPKTKIYVQSIFPVGKSFIFNHNNKTIIPLNAELKKMCSEMQLTYIDFYSKFTDETGYLNATLTNDNLHLLGNGYLLWKNIIADYISE